MPQCRNAMKLIFMPFNMGGEHVASVAKKEDRPCDFSPMVDGVELRGVDSLYFFFSESQVQGTKWKEEPDSSKVQFRKMGEIRTNLKIQRALALSLPCSMEHVFWDT